MSDKNTKDKQIPNPDNPEELIDNPDYVEPSDDNDNEDDDDEDDDDDLSPELKEKLEKLVAAQLKTMKKNMDRLDKSHKDALAQVKEFERKEREAETARLREEGKLEEAFQREKDDLEAKLADQEKVITRLTRDMEVRDALSGYDFKNDRARKNAVRDITEELVKDDNGIWKHKSGKSIAEYAKAFIEDEENAFFLKPKVSRGSGVDKSTAPEHDKNKDKSIFDIPQDEVLKRIMERRNKQRQK